MATKTAFFDLTKPAGTDSVDITVLNDNFDRIDAQMQLNKENIDKDTVGATELNDGIGGRVPAPPAGFQDAFLSGSGTWRRGLTQKQLILSSESTGTLIDAGVLRNDAGLQISMIVMRTDVADVQAASVYIVRAIDGEYNLTPIFEGTSADAPLVSDVGVLSLNGSQQEQTVYISALDLIVYESSVIDSSEVEEG